MVVLSSAHAHCTRLHHVHSILLVLWHQTYILVHCIIILYWSAPLMDLQKHWYCMTFTLIDNPAGWRHWTSHELNNSRNNPTHSRGIRTHFWCICWPIFVVYLLHLKHSIIILIFSHFLIIMEYQIIDSLCPNMTLEASNLTQRWSAP